MIYAFGTLIIAALGISIYLQLSSRKKGVDPEELKRKIDECGQLKSDVQKERSEKDKLEANGKAMYSRFKDLESDHKAKSYECDELKKRLNEYEANESARRRELEEQFQKLHRAEKSLEEEKLRVRREDEERQKQLIEERDRMWGEHEENVQALLTELCKKPETAFESFSNTNLPAEFDGSLKPDFMIEFLGQYIIFDAKVTRSQDVNVYIKDQVKKTAKKAKGRTDIYRSIFLVVPTDAISELKALTYYEEGFTFFAVSPEALPPILASLKKITNYELAEQFDPEERENIVSLIAKFDYHISERNTFDILMAGKGAEVLKNAEQLHPELLAEVERKKGKMGLPNFKKSEIKKLINDVAERERAAKDLTEPRAAIQTP